MMDENALELKYRGLRFDLDYFKSQRKQYLMFGGFAIKSPNEVCSYSNQFGLHKEELLKKDIYFTFLFLRPLLEGFNKSIIYGDRIWELKQAYIGSIYTFVKSIYDDIHRIYGNCYDYGLYRCLEKLHNIAIKYNTGICYPEEKRRDNLKRNIESCISFIITLISVIGFIFLWKQYIKVV